MIFLNGLNWCQYQILQPMFIVKGSFGYREELG